jgi:predicted ATPase
LVGDNGIGKSSLLQLLADIFCPVQRSKEQKHLPHFEITYEMTTVEDENQVTSHILVYSHDSDFPKLYPSKLIVSSHSAFDPYQLTPKYGLRLRKINIPKESTYVYCGPNESNYSSLETAINAVLKTNLSFDVRVLEGYNKLFKNIGYGKLVYCEVDFRRIPRRKKEMIDLLKQELITSDLFSRLETCMEEFSYLRKQSFNRHPSREFTHLVPLAAINPELINIMLHLVSFDAPNIIRDLWFSSPDGTTEVPLSEFSSGELTMLYRFLPLVLEIEPNSIILIDEPETHLHPKWAQGFIEYLNDLFGGFEAHIILATHSPIIISDVPTESLVILEKHNGVIGQRLPSDRTFGATSTDILKDVFFMKQISGNQSVEVLRRIHQQLISGDQAQINEARQLYQMLSTTFEKYELFQKYKKQLGDTLSPS